MAVNGKAGTTADLLTALEKKTSGNTADKQIQPINPMQALLERHKDQISMALPRAGLTMDRFIRIATTTWNMNPDLKQCDPKTFIASVMLSAQVGLEPGGPMGQAWLVPYAGKVQFQIGYKGYLTMMWRSGEYKSVAVHEVCEKDDFDFEYGLDEKLRHKPAIGERGNVIGYYLTAHYTNGGHFIYWMSRHDVERIRTFSQAPNSPAWKNHYDAMARKTLLKQASRWMPMSIEAERTLAQDDAIKMDLAEDMTATPTMEAEFSVIDEPGANGGGL